MRKKQETKNVKYAHEIKEWKRSKPFEVGSHIVELGADSYNVDLEKKYPPEHGLVGLHFTTIPKIAVIDYSNRQIHKKVLHGNKMTEKFVEHGWTLPTGLLRKTFPHNFTINLYYVLDKDDPNPIAVLSVSNKRWEMCKKTIHEGGQEEQAFLAQDEFDIHFLVDGKESVVLGEVKEKTEAGDLKFGIDGSFGGA